MQVDSAVAARVRAFYEELPFNYEAGEDAAAAQVRGNPLRAYPDLDALLRTGGIRSVLDVGCGAGWLANAVALHYPSVERVVGVDLCERALARAGEVATRLGTDDRVGFRRADLFAFTPDAPPDLVTSVGVLHHTADCAAAVRRVASFVDAGGWLFVGLYHAYGRRPFLELFAELLADGGEEAAFARYQALNAGQGDEVFLRSWFRDQVLHPHETQHTLEEVCGWLEPEGFSLRSSSINRCAPFAHPRELFARERDYEALSLRRNRDEGRFFPGFFTLLARRG
jgi:SAM-dependent methyltransferase